MPFRPCLRVCACPVALISGSNVSSPPALRKRASPVVVFSVHEVPGGPSLEPLPGQGVPTSSGRAKSHCPL